MSTTPSPLTALNQLRIDDIRAAPSTVRIAVVGEIDLTTAPTLQGRVLTVLHERTPAVLVVDLAGVTFMDCAGIGMLVAARNAAAHSGSQVLVSHPQPTVRRLLDMVGLLGILTAPIDQPQPARSAHPSRGGAGLSGSRAKPGPRPPGHADAHSNRTGLP